MAYTNNNKKVHDTPVWLPTGQFRTATQVLASMSTSKSTNERYIYYLAGTLFYKYDTWKDVHIKLASPMIAAVTASSIKFTRQEGYRCNCLGSTATSATIPGLYSDVFVGKELEITSGTGAGQIRTITSVADPVILDQGIITGVSTNLSITDNLKKCQINQYIGFQV